MSINCHTDLQTDQIIRIIIKTEIAISNGLVTFVLAEESISELCTLK